MTGLEKEAIRVMVVDDQPLMRRGLARLLESEGFTVVGEATDGVDALGFLAACDPDALPHAALVDVRMPGMDGVTLIGRMAADFPTVSAIVLTTFDEDEYLFAGLRAGARAYLLKDAEPEEVALAVRRVAAGGSFLVGPAADRMIAFLRGRDTTPDSLPGGDPGDELSGREGEVASLVGQGASNREIARALGLAEGTVRNHVTNILHKLGLRDRTQLALWMVSR
ncbi:response regulator transcription factor [Nocardiopsis sp. CC223A]|uniref:response regulator n=1 Tax=Nocardiopsis sp. CC223A TaxID=3044051 RepID=UPI00278C7273|nr:response regulator transcription factor [Nocardiopsis sp. CC223A]